MEILYTIFKINEKNISSEFNNEFFSNKVLNIEKPFVNSEFETMPEAIQHLKNNIDTTEEEGQFIILPVYHN